MKLASFIYQDIRSFGIVKAEGMIDLGRRLGDRYGDLRRCCRVTAWLKPAAISTTRWMCPWGA